MQHQNTPSDRVIFAAIQATEGDLATYENTLSSEDRERFLAAMSDLMYLAMEWVEPFAAAGEEPPKWPEDMRARFLHLNDARNRMIRQEAPA